MLSLCPTQVYPVLLLLLLTLIVENCQGRQSQGVARRGGHSDEDEDIQSYVFHKAKRLGYGLRLFPKVTEYLLGSASSKSSKSPPSKSSFAASRPAGAARRDKRIQQYMRPARQSSHVRKPVTPGFTRVKSDHQRLRKDQGKKWSKRYVGQNVYSARPPYTFFSSSLPLPLLKFTSKPPRPQGRPPRPPRPSHSPHTLHHPHHLNRPAVKSLPVVSHLHPFHHHEALRLVHDPLAPVHVAHQSKPPLHINRPPNHPHPISHAFNPIAFNPHPSPVRFVHQAQSPHTQFQHKTPRVTPDPQSLQLTTPHPIRHHAPNTLAPVHFTSSGTIIKSKKTDYV